MASRPAFGGLKTAWVVTGSHEGSDAASTDATARSPHRSVSSPATMLDDDDLFFGRGGEAATEVRFVQSNQLALACASTGARHDAQERVSDAFVSPEEDYLLAMISELARGVSGPTRSDADTDPAAPPPPISSELERLLPPALLDKDPQVVDLRERCSRLREGCYEQARSSQEVQESLQGELDAMRKRQEVQTQQWQVIIEHATASRPRLAEGMIATSEAQRALRGRVATARQGNDARQTVLSNGLKRLNSRSAALQADLAAASVRQSRIAEDFTFATEKHTQMQAELEAARLAVRELSTEFLAAFARGGVPAEALRALDASAVGAGASAVAIPGVFAGLGDVAKRNSGWTERATWLRSRVDGAEESAELEQGCRQKFQQLDALGLDLATERSETTRLNKCIQALEDQAARFGLRGCEVVYKMPLPLVASPNAPPSVETEAAHWACEAESAKEVLDSKEDSHTQERRRVQDWQSRLESEREELRTLIREIDDQAKAQMRNMASMEQVRADVAKLSTELEEIAPELEEEEQIAEAETLALRADTARWRKSLERQRAAVRKVNSDLARKRWCWRRRPQSHQTE